MTTRQRLIDCLMENGADLVAFGGIERFAGTEATRIFPQARTVVGIAFRVLRGSHRGIEEGTTYYQYGTTGVETLEETVMPMALLRGCALLEDEGFEALPQRRIQTVLRDPHGTNPEMLHEEIFRGVEVERQLDFEQAAVLCGLGERSLYGSLLTDDFGPLQRYCFLLTDAALEETPLAIPHLCDRCGACQSACPGGAIAADGSLDRWQCAVYYKGGSRANNPFLPPDALMGIPDREAILRGQKHLSEAEARQVLAELYYYPPYKHAYCGSICGRACDMACYAHLEERGALRRKFRTPYRKRPPFKLPV